MMLTLEQMTSNGFEFQLPNGYTGTYHTTNGGSITFNKDGRDVRVIEHVGEEEYIFLVLTFTQARYHRMEPLLREWVEKVDSFAGRIADVNSITLSSTLDLGYRRFTHPRTGKVYGFRWDCDYFTVLRHYRFLPFGWPVGRVYTVSELICILEELELDGHHSGYQFVKGQVEHMDIDLVRMFSRSVAKIMENFE